MQWINYSAGIGSDKTIAYLFLGLKCDFPILEALYFTNIQHLIAPPMAHGNLMICLDLYKKLVDAVMKKCPLLQQWTLMRGSLQQEEYFWWRGDVCVEVRKYRTPIAEVRITNKNASKVLAIETHNFENKLMIQDHSTDLFYFLRRHDLDAQIESEVAAFLARHSHLLV